MASISKDKDGTRRIQFVSMEGKRVAIRLGKVSQRAAETVKFRVEQLLAVKMTGQPLEADAAKWIGELEPKMAEKLSRAGLIDKVTAETLGAFLEALIASRKGDYKPASLIAWGQVSKALREFFGDCAPLTSISQARAEEFRQAMLAGDLRPTTIHKRLQHARMFFEQAKRKNLIAANPFEYVRHRPGDASERRAYVPEADVLRVIEFAPNHHWKLLIALSRFAGLRVPSEALSLRWQDVDWERNRLTIPSPKTEHLAGRGYRVIPLFPAVRPYLETAFQEAPEGAVYVFPEEYRVRAHGPGGWKNTNFRTTFAKIIRKAGLESWSRLWHSMRASCETDLARRFPLAIVAKWLGNTQAVAMRHYVDVTDGDFERASGDAKAAQIPAQQSHEMLRNVSQSILAGVAKPRELQWFAGYCDMLRRKSLEAAGIEPAS
jgi:integrase